MPTNYPISVDTTATLPAASGVGAQLSTFPHSVIEGNQNDAIRAIQTELGTQPSGPSATVKARLDALEAAVWTALPASGDWGDGFTYRKLGNIGFISGKVTWSAGSGSTASSVIATLPGGYRPSGDVYLVGSDDTVAAEGHTFKIASNGEIVKLGAGGTGDQYFVSGIYPLA